MPELPEVESYRQLAETAALDRPVAAIEQVDARYLRGGLERTDLDVLVGRRFVAARRIGKLALLDTDGGPTLGLHFGMSGTLMVDDCAGVPWLLYTSRRDERRWRRFVARFDDGGHLSVRDPRRFGRVELDPDESRLGTDLLDLTLPGLRRALTGSQVALKARLLDQARIAGIGNLIADEVLWRAGLDPVRAAGSLTAAEERRLHRRLLSTTADLINRGGSHEGDFLPSRVAGGRCPRDGAVLERRTVGGRTTYSCPRHQR